MPTVLRIGPYRFYFYSHEPNEPPHIHIDREAASAKFWLNNVALARNIGFSAKELGVLQRLVDTGNTVLVIEHHLDVIKQADHIIDLGPAGGDRGGEIIAEGSPEEVARIKDSLTGRYLRGVLGRRADQREAVAAGE